MASKRKKHPGVVLIKPEPTRNIGWRARYIDPDRDTAVKESLDRALTTVAQREAWCVNKSRALAKRRAELDTGAPRATGAALSGAVDGYFKAHPQLRPRTVKIYRRATDKLIAWATSAGVRTADELTRARLLEFRAAAVASMKHTPLPGAPRGHFVATSARRAAPSINQDVRSARTVLGYLVDADALPRLTFDDLRKALKRIPVTSERIEYLRPRELQELLGAALRHDSVTYAATRQEHAGLRPHGKTPRYEAIAPFTAFVLLTGCRFAEALGLEWRAVDLDALDHEGRKVGEIHLTGASTKTHKARTIGLEVSPALRAMLAALHLRCGGKGSVFGLSRGTVEAAGKRLRNEYDAPEAFTWQGLRRTCGTYLTNAPGIFGAASAYRSARQLGHSVQIAERHYLGLVRGISPTARTLEAAMQIEDLMARVLAAVDQHPNATSVAEAV